MLTVEFWRPEHLQRRPGRAGKVFTAEISPDELAGLLEDGIAALGDGPASQPPLAAPARKVPLSGKDSRCSGQRAQ